MTASAGKLHFLDAAELKDRLGSKWSRMAGHVDKFFEAAIRRNLGVADSFVRRGELSYLVMFHGLSPDEAQVKCLAISEEVCTRLFGEHSIQASLRNLVGQVTNPGRFSGDQSEALDKFLEREGVETIVGAPKAEKRDGPEPQYLSIRQSEGDSRSICLSDIEFVYRPVWDTIKQVVVIYLCQPTIACLRRPDDAGDKIVLADNVEDQAVLDNIALRECAARARRLHADGFRILMAVPIGFTTITHSRLWQDYAGAFRALPRDIARDLGSVVIGIERGVPNVKLGQELPKLASLTSQMFCIADDVSNVGSRFARTGTHAVGISLGSDEPEPRSTERMNRLYRQSLDAGLDAFVLGVHSTSVVLTAMSIGIRYLEGPAIRPTSADPQHAFAQSLEYLYAAKLQAAAR